MAWHRGGIATSATLLTVQYVTQRPCRVSWWAYEVCALCLRCTRGQRPSLVAYLSKSSQALFGNHARCAPLPLVRLLAPLQRWKQKLRQAHLVPFLYVTSTPPPRWPAECREAATCQRSSMPQMALCRTFSVKILIGVACEMRPRAVRVRGVAAADGGGAVVGLVEHHFWRVTTAATREQRRRTACVLQIHNRRPRTSRCGDAAGLSVHTSVAGGAASGGLASRFSLDASPSPSLTGSATHAGPSSCPANVRRYASLGATSAGFALEEPLHAKTCSSCSNFSALPNLFRGTESAHSVSRSTWRGSGAATIAVRTSTRRHVPATQHQWL